MILCCFVLPSYGDNTYSHSAHSALKSLDVVLLYFLR